MRENDVLATTIHDSTKYDVWVRFLLKMAQCARVDINFIILQPGSHLPEQCMLESSNGVR